MVVLGSAAEARRRFRSFGVPLVVSCTQITWPPVQRCPAYKDIPSPYAKKVPSRVNMLGSPEKCKFPCGGAMMGYKSAFLGLFTSAGFTETTDDQCWLHSTLSQ